MKKHYKSKIAAIAVGTAIKVLTGVVCGAVVLTGTYGVVKHTVLPNSTAKTQSMFAYEGEAGGTGGGSIGDNPIYQTELKRNGVIPAGGVYTLADGTQLIEGDSFPEAPVTGDIYEEGDYTYTFGTNPITSNNIGNSWSVVVKDTGKTEYGEIISEIAETSVKDMDATFYNCTSLITAPAIPSSVTSIFSTFGNCYSLTTAPSIPSSVTNIGFLFNCCYQIKTYIGSTDSAGDFSNYVIPSGVTVVAHAFEFCSSLTIAPTIPNGITDMSYIFNGCTSLTTAPVIPNGVTNIEGAFYECTSLTTAPVIPGGVTNMYSTFYYCSSLTTAPAIPNSVTNMTSTFQGCSSLTTAPTIPSSVEETYGTFKDCVSLTGTIGFNANPFDYEYCFDGTVKPITLTGSSTILSELAGTATNGNVTVG